MSSRVNDCSSFLQVLLNAGKFQAKAILLTASEEQVKCVGEIAYNIRRIPLGKKARELVQKSRKILNSLSNFAISTERRLATIQRYVKRIIDILMAVKDRLLAVMAN